MTVVFIYSTFLSIQNILTVGLKPNVCNAVRVADVLEGDRGDLAVILPTIVPPAIKRQLRSRQSLLLVLLAR